MSAVKMSDDELMKAWRAKIGEVAVPGLNDAPFCQLITHDAVTNFCLSVGDLNPLWCDRRYGLQSRYGDNVAPPHMLFALAPWAMHGGVLAGMRTETGDLMPKPGESGVQGGIRIEWVRRLRVGDKVTCEPRLIDVQTHRSRTWGRTFELVTEFTFKDQQFEPVALAEFSLLFTEHRDVQGPRNLPDKMWSAAELEEVRRMYAEQPAKVRGARPRYWEDVHEGDELPAIVKGPYTETSYIAFCLGVPLRRIHATDEVYWNYAYDQHIKEYPHRGVLGSHELTRQGVPAGHRYHFDYDSAAKRGLPAPIDVGHQRVCWLGQFVTMWMGDHGFLQRLSVRHKDVHMMGDLTTCKGVVRQKESHDGERLAHCDIWCETHRGRSSEGTAVVVLPSKERGAFLRI